MGWLAGGWIVRRASLPSPTPNLCPHLIQFTELNVKNNFALVYELLDEVIDYGVVQLTDADALKSLVTQSGLVVNSLAEQEKITSAVTGAIGWRRDGIKYRKQEVGREGEGGGGRGGNRIESSPHHPCLSLSPPPSPSTRSTWTCWRACTRWCLRLGRRCRRTCRGRSG